MILWNWRNGEIGVNPIGVRLFSTAIGRWNVSVITDDTLVQEESACHFFTNMARGGVSCAQESGDQPRPRRFEIW